MAESDTNSFPIVNGLCSISGDQIHLTSDAATMRLERLFGNNLLRRSIIFALILGIPLAIVGVWLIKQGDFVSAVWPLAFAIMFLSSPLFHIGYSNPKQIDFRAIQAVTSHPPTRFRSLGSFTIYFQNDGLHTRTTIALPCCDYSDRQKAFQHASNVLAQAGLTVVGHGQTNA